MLKSRGPGTVLFVYCMHGERLVLSERVGERVGWYVSLSWFGTATWLIDLCDCSLYRRPDLSTLTLTGYDPTDRFLTFLD